MYKSPTSAAKAMGLDYYNITRNINKNFYVAAPNGVSLAHTPLLFQVW